MKRIRVVAAVLLGIAAGVPLFTDSFGVGTATQYIYNFVYLVVVLPACIYISGVMEREYCGTESSSSDDLDNKQMYE